MFQRYRTQVAKHDHLDAVGDDIRPWIISPLAAPGGPLLPSFSISSQCDRQVLS